MAAFGACTLGLAQTAAAAPGLATTSAEVTVPRVGPRLFLGDGEGFTPRSAVDGIEWAGQLAIPRAGDYTFFVTAGSLRIDGALIGDDPVRLTAGSHRFELSSPRRPGPAKVAVEWEGPGFLREPIPPRHFTHDRAGSASLDGRALFEDLGCSNCHRSDSPSLQRRPGPILTGLGSRVKPAWIRHWLDNPEGFRSWATMPRMLSDEERSDVAAFLAAQRSPDREEARFRNRHSERGRTTFQSFGCAACHGSDLPLQGLGSKMSVSRLQEFLLDPIRFSPDGRMPSFHLDAEEALELAAYLALSRNEAFEAPVRAGDIARGRELVRTSGCLACHSLDGLDSSSDAPSLEELVETRGCLEEAVPAGLPRYRLSADQRVALRSFISAYRASPDRVPAPTFDLPRRLAQLRCHACHEINGEPRSGSLAEAAPPLTGAGEKLRSEWIERVVGSETQVLDWQELRMPSFGSEHARWLADALPKAAGIDPETPAPAAAAGDQEAGLGRLGVDASQGGMGCVGCHGWGEFPALGENGPNLFTTGERLRAPWYRRWMRDPARILAGTSMPNYFGGSDSPESRELIGDMWAAFRAAKDQPPPAGFRRVEAAMGGEALPIPGDRAIVVRWDMPEATPAAIAVGLPGGTSFCFDAGESRLRYVWRGGFVDLSLTLLDKKNRETNLTETAAIVGEIFYREGPYPIRVGDRERIPQRRFRGYRLVDSIPEFHYEVDGVAVHERILPAEDGVVRRFRIESVTEPMWFEPAAADGVEIRSTLEGFAIPLGDNVLFEVSVAAKQ